MTEANGVADDLVLVLSVNMLPDELALCFKMSIEPLPFLLHDFAELKLGSLQLEAVIIFGSHS